MAKSLKKKDYKYVLLLFISLILIFPLLIKTDEEVEDLESFELQLFYRLTKTKPGMNLIITPFSLASLILLLRMDAAPDVVEEINIAYHLTNLSDSVILQKFRKLFLKYKHPHLFTMTNKITLVSEGNAVHKIEMNANQTVNAWTEYDVCYRSWQLSSPFKPSDLILTTENHFNNILLKYSVDTVTKGTFYNSDKKNVDMDMIVILAKLRYARIDELKVRVVELPYSDDDTSLLFLVPYKNDGINTLEKDLVAYSLPDILSYTKFDYVKLNVPNLFTTAEFTLKEELKALGLKTMFKRLCDIPHLVRVAEIHYKSSFLINDKNARDDPFFGENLTAIANFQEVLVDHPFIYILKSASNVIYLIGKYLK